MALTILGALTFGFNPSACLLKNGELIAFAEEERFNRIKTAFNCFPIYAIRYCLEAAKTDLAEVDAIAVPWDCPKYPGFMREFYDEGRKRFGDKGEPTRQWEEATLGLFHPDRFEKRLTEGLRKNGYYGKIPEIVYVPHHLSHAASAFFPSDFQEAAILTMDGSGEEKCSAIWKGTGGDIELRQEFQIPDSLGWFYSTFTQWLGFQPNLDEGKLMGLAPYGKSQAELFKKMDRIVSRNDRGYAVDPFFTFYGEQWIGKGFSRRIVDVFGKPREPREEITADHRDLAFAVQSKLEQVAVDLAGRALSLAKSENLCLAGGVCLNCKMNGVIFDRTNAQNIFIQPISNDAGATIGAALWLHRQRTGERPRFRMKHAYLGPEFDNDQIERTLKSFKLKFSYHEQVEETAADLLADGKLVAWFQGRMEGGSRALGARSILADPTRVEMKDKVNAEVKKRELWRPFCPSVTAEDKEKYFINACDSPFMILAFQVIPDAIPKMPAVVHVDGSARPQTVSNETNPRFWRLLKHFEARRGVPVILNTSFNIQGEPIICKPEEAIRSFYSTGLDALVMGNFVLKK